METAIIAGHDSGFAQIIIPELISQQWRVISTSRRPQISEHFGKNNLIYSCDFTNRESIDDCISQMSQHCSDWKLLVLSIGMLNPIDLLSKCPFDEWEQSIQVNFINQLYFIQVLLNSTDLRVDRKILTFAGSGTNSAPVNFSAYTLSKIALIKAMELLAAEYPSQTFVSLGTGWMNTPIHQQTLDAGARAGIVLFETVRRKASDDFGKFQMLLDFIVWVLSTPRELISGRNFSLQGDDWQSRDFIDKLGNSSQTFKLRRMNQP